MKPVEFDYERPATLDEALELLAQPNARVLAGGQSIGPMLNLRLVQPTLLVDITAIEALRETSREDGTLQLGACVTHTAIEDGNLRDVTNKAMASVARNIAYRAVRNRGTIGGSLVHADPAADWLTCLSALGADVIAAGVEGERRMLGYWEVAQERRLAEEEGALQLRDEQWASSTTSVGWHVMGVWHGTDGDEDERGAQQQAVRSLDVNLAAGAERRCAVAAISADLRLYRYPSVEKRPKPRFMHGHGGAVKGVRFADEGHALVSVGGDQAVMVITLDMSPISNTPWCL